MMDGIAMLLAIYQCDALFWRWWAWGLFLLHAQICLSGVFLLLTGASCRRTPVTQRFGEGKNLQWLCQRKGLSSAFLMRIISKVTSQMFKWRKISDWRDMVSGTEVLSVLELRHGNQWRQLFSVCDTLLMLMRHCPVLISKLPVNENTDYQSWTKTLNRF